MAQQHESPRHEPVLEAEIILMVDFISTQARAKGEAPSASREGSHTEPAAAEPLSASSPPTTDGVDRLYRQLVEIKAITATQLVECDR
jgi:hypothetical protein